MRESEQRLTLAFGALPLGIAIVDPAGEIVTANDGMRRFLPTGRVPSRDAGRGGRWQAWDADGGVVPQNDYPAARALRGERVFPGLQRLYLDDDGAQIWTEVSSVPLQDPDGKTSGVISVVSDVDRLKRSEEEARASEERLSRFGEASQDILWIRDAATLQWTYLTPAFEDIYGLSREEALSGDNWHNWEELIVDEDRERAVANILRVRDREKVNFEYRIRRPVDGEIRWLRNTDFPIRDEAWHVVRIGGVGSDVTRMKAIEAAVAASEERSRTLMEGIPQLVWRSCDKGLWTWSSPQWREFTGQSQKQSQGLGWCDAIHPDDRQATTDAWDKAKPHGMLETLSAGSGAPSTVPGCGTTPVRCRCATPTDASSNGLEPPRIFTSCASCRAVRA